MDFGMEATGKEMRILKVELSFMPLPLLRIPPLCLFLYVYLATYLSMSSSLCSYQSSSLCIKHFHAESPHVG